MRVEGGSEVTLLVGREEGREREGTHKRPGRDESAREVRNWEWKLGRDLLRVGYRKGDGTEPEKLVHMQVSTEG